MSAGAIVDLAGGCGLDGTRTRRDLDPAGSADAILRSIVGCAAAAIGTAVAPRLGVAMPARSTTRGDRAVRGCGQVRRAERRRRRRGAAVRARRGDRDVVFVNDARRVRVRRVGRGVARGEAGRWRSPSAPASAPRSSIAGPSSRTGPGSRPPGARLEDRRRRRAARGACSRPRHPAGRRPAIPPSRTRAPTSTTWRWRPRRRRGRRAVFDDAFDALGRGLGPWLARFEATHARRGRLDRRRLGPRRGAAGARAGAGDPPAGARPARDARRRRAPARRGDRVLRSCTAPAAGPTLAGQATPRPRRERPHGRHDADGSVRRPRARAPAVRGPDAQARRRRAGVSPMTASRVLHGDPGVKPESRDAVLLAVETLGYRRNELARNLRLGRTAGSSGSWSPTSPTRSTRSSPWASRPSRSRRGTGWCSPTGEEAEREARLIDGARRAARRRDHRRAGRARDHAAHGAGAARATSPSCCVPGRRPTSPPTACSSTTSAAPREATISMAATGHPAGSGYLGMPPSAWTGSERFRGSSVRARGGRTRRGRAIRAAQPADGRRGRGGRAGAFRPRGAARGPVLRQQPEHDRRDPRPRPDAASIRLAGSTTSSSPTASASR